MACSRYIRLLCSTAVAALALAGLFASSAAGAAWTIEGKTLSELSLSEESIVSSATPLTIEVPSLALKVECELEKGSGKILGPGGSEATMELSKCKVVESKVCTVSEPILLKVKGELTKKAGVVYEVLKPLAGETFGTFTIKGEACAFAKEFKLTGSTAVQPSLEEAVKEPLKFSKAIAEAAGTKMLAGASAAFLVGTSNQELSGVKNKGKKWSVCAICSFSFGVEEGYGAGNPAAPNVLPAFEGDGINVFSGNLFQEQNDLAVAGRGPALELTRYYNSQLAASAKSAGSFGFGWTSTYSASLVIDEKNEIATVRNDNGSTVVFFLVEGKYQASPWVQAKLAKEGANYVYTLPNQLKLLFNGTGQLTKETDRHGNAVSLAYNAKSQLETVTDGAGRTLTFVYNAGGQVESVKDPLGHLSKYTYEAGNLTKVVLPVMVAPRWEFQYDGSHRLTKVTDGRGHPTINEYDASNRLSLQTDALEQKHKPEYKETAGVKETTITEPNSSKTFQKFNSAGEPTEVIKASGSAVAQTTKYEYDGSFQLTKITDGNLHSTTFGYDAEGNKTSEKDANENETKWAYNSTHDLISETTPKKEVTTITRNAAGDPEVIKRPAPGATTQETKFEFAANGDLKSKTDPLTRKTTYEYDTYGDLKAETNPAGDKRTWTYNENGQLTSEVSPRGNEEGAEPSKFETKIEPDALGHPIKVTDPLGHETKYKYDADGHLEVLTNPNGHATTYVYDAVDQRVEVKAANGNVAKTAYDSMGEVKSKTDGNTHTTKYERNLLEQITEEVDPLERKTLRAYDSAGNLKEVKDAEGRTATYTYDVGDRLKEVKFSEEATKAIAYEYGKDDEITVMKDATGTTTNTYDELDRLTEVKNGNAEVVKYKYNLGDQITEITYPNTKAIIRTYDLAGRLETVKDWLGKETKFSYNRDSMPKAVTFPAVTTNKDEYAYNNADELTKTTMLKGAATLASIEYTRFNAGQLKAGTQKGLPGIEKPEYAYDLKERMTTGAGFSFEYDAANNPTKVGAPTYTYDAANQLKEGGGVKYGFNKVGQRTSMTPAAGPATTYGYDQTGNMVSINRKAEGEVKEIKDTFAYDGTGLRASETLNGTTTHMAWDTSGSLPLLLYDGTSYYLYGPGGLPFEQITAEVPTYLHHDQLGSTRLLTNEAGENKGTYTYTPYGATEGHAGTATTALGYNGQYTGKDTGLIYLRARVLDPVTGQFMSVDPLAGTTGAPYFYAGNSPVNGGDPSGLQDPANSNGIWPIFEHGFGVAGNYQGSTDLGTYGLSGWADIRGWWHVAGSSQGSTPIGNYNVSGYAGSGGWHFNGSANGSTPFGTYNVFGWAGPEGWHVNGSVQGSTALGSYGVFGWAGPEGWHVNGTVQGNLLGGSYNVSGFAEPDRWHVNGSVQGDIPIGHYAISGWAGNEGYGVGGSLSGTSRYGSYGIFGAAGEHAGWSLGVWAAFHW